MALFQTFGFNELLIVLAIVLLLFGPTQLPKLMKSIGKGAKSLREGLDAGLEEGDDEPEKSEGKKSEGKKAVSSEDDEE